MDHDMLENLPGIRPVLEQITEKWSLMIIVSVCTAPLRFNAIKRLLPGITQKALTQTLRRLERNGLVSRTVIATSPIAVLYESTPLGLSLSVPFTALYDWTLEHLAEIESAQKLFDTKT